jgi:hypothetical protein
LVSAPDGAAGAGLGLWLAHQLPTVDIALIAGADGFTVRLCAGQPPGAENAPADDVPLPAGAAHGTVPGPGGVHLVDGDGTSLCELVAAPDLGRLDDVSWRSIPPDRQCPHCRVILMVHLDRPGGP